MIFCLAHHDKVRVPPRAALPFLRVAITMSVKNIPPIRIMRRTLRGIRGFPTQKHTHINDPGHNAAGDN